jgi:site-specific DNA-methyltransferase (adenine-specific)
MIKPYYEDKWVKIFLGDCREILPQLDVKVDLVLTDPPYNATDIGPNHRIYINQTMKLSDGEYADFCSTWFNLILNITERISFTPGIANLWLYPAPKWVLCWHKPSAISYNKLGGFNAWEPILIYGKPKGRFGQDYIRQDPLNFSQGPEKNHPCPKPQKVWDWIINGMSEAGDLILDPFLGSGTTAYCAKKLNRRCIGIEIEEKYCEIAAKRCCQEVMELGL